MLNKFRRIISIFIIIIECVCISQALAAADQTFEVQTSVGVKTVVVPDGMSIEDAYCEMARLYIEEKAGYDSLLEQTQELVAKTKDYEELSLQLISLKQNLSDKETELVGLYKELSKTPFISPVVLVGVMTTEFKKVDSVALSAGVFVSDTFLILADVSYPWSFGLKLGMRF